MGTGFADLIVGAPKSDLMGTDSGAAYLFFGGGGTVIDETADVVLRGPAASNWFGGSVARAGDVNGDGYSDIVIGAPDQSGDEALGRAYVYLGAKQPAATIVAAGLLAGSIAGMNFGADVAGAGDIDGDGFADVMVNASSYLSSDASESCTSALSRIDPGLLSRKDPLRGDA
jgi:FG-GAP repeat